MGIRGGKEKKERGTFFSFSFFGIINSVSVMCFLSRCYSVWGINISFPHSGPIFSGNYVRRLCFDFESHLSMMRCAKWLCRAAISGGFADL